MSGYCVHVKTDEFHNAITKYAQKKFTELKMINEKSVCVIYCLEKHVC